MENVSTTLLFFLVVPPYTFGIKPPMLSLIVIFFFKY